MRERVYANVNQRRAATVRRFGRCLVTVRAASGEALTPRTCAKASSSSLLASRRPIALNGGRKLEFGGYLGFGRFLTCSRKFALYAALYIGVLDRIVVGKDSNTFLVCITLYLMKILKKSGRG
jgi:hypothetical protein